MSISNTTVRQLFAGDGSTVAFAIPFVFQFTTEIVVYRIDNSNPSSPTLTLLALTTDYTLTGGTPSQPTTVTMNVAPTNVQELLIIRVTALTQGTSYIQNGTFPAKSHENALDKLTQVAQELSNELNQTIQLPLQSSLTNITLGNPIPYGLIRWNSAGNGLENPALGVTTPLIWNASTAALSIQVANTSQGGYLSASDWNLFNTKQVAGSYLTGLSGDVVAAGPGVGSATIQAGAITDSKIAGGANIALAKLAALTISRALVSDGSGVVSVSAVTAAELGFVSGVLSPIQTQLNAKYQSGNSPSFANVTITGWLSTNRRDESSAATINSLGNSKSFVKLTATVATINGIAAGADGQIIVIYNNTGSPVSISNLSGSAASSDQIVTTDGNPITLNTATPQAFIYDAGQSKWVVWGGGGGGGGGSGNVTGQASSVDGEISLFSGTSGKIIKRATGSGFVKATSGVYSTVANIDLTADVASTVLPIANGGTNGATATAGFNNLSPLTTRGDIIVMGAVNNQRLGIGSANTVLVTNGTDPSWALLVDANISASAAIARSKIATGTTGQVVINDPSTGALSSEAQLAMSRGGTNAALVANNGGIVYSTGSALAILAGTSSANQTLVSGASTTPAWQWGSLPQVFGTAGAPRSIVAATGITSGASHMSTTALEQIIFVQGSVAGDSVAATISAGTIVGQRMTIIGKSATNTMTLDDATTTNVIGKKTFGLNDRAGLIWDGSNWLLG